MRAGRSQPARSTPPRRRSSPRCRPSCRPRRVRRRSQSVLPGKGAVAPARHVAGRHDIGVAGEDETGAASPRRPSRFSTASSPSPNTGRSTVKPSRARQSATKASAPAWLGVTEGQRMSATSSVAGTSALQPGRDRSWINHSPFWWAISHSFTTRGLDGDESGPAATDRAGASQGCWPCGRRAFRFFGQARLAGAGLGRRPRDVDIARLRRDDHGDDR